MRETERQRVYIYIYIYIYICLQYIPIPRSAVSVFDVHMHIVAKKRTVRWPNVKTKQISRSSTRRRQEKAPSLLLLGKRRAIVDTHILSVSLFLADLKDKNGT